MAKENQDRVLTIFFKDGSKQRIKLRKEFFTKGLSTILPDKERIEKLKDVCRQYSNGNYTHYTVV
jgi:hypothetical protein